MRKALGKGLDALIPTSDQGTWESLAHGVQVQKISVDRIRPNRLQPRKHFDPEKLHNLAQSIKEHGLTQPIIVSKPPEGDNYELVVGERRWRACRIVGITKIDAIVRPPLTNQDRLAVSLIENLQRADINPIEQGLAYKRLVQDFNMTQEEISRVVGKSRPSVANTLRLLELPEEIQNEVKMNRITEGHARVLLSVADPLIKKGLFEKTMKMNLSVRELEKEVQVFSERKRKRIPNIKKILGKSAEIKALESELQHGFGTNVEINLRKGNKGKVIFDFYSLDDLGRLVSLLKKERK